MCASPIGNQPLPQFLQGYFELREKHGNTAFRGWYMNQLRQKARAVNTFRAPMGLLSAATSWTRRIGSPPRRKSPQVLFDGIRFMDLAKSLTGHLDVSIVARKPQDILRIAAAGARPVPGWMWHQDIARLLGEPASDVNNELRAPSTMLTELQQAKPDIVVLTNDSLPFERGVLAAAFSLGIPTVTLQHGFFSTRTPIDLLDGHTSDYFLTWGDALVDRFVEFKPVNETRVWTYGYPYKILVPRFAPTTMRSVVIVGLPIENYRPDRLSTYIHPLLEIVAALLDRGAKVTYRRHPVEGTSAIAALLERFPDSGLDVKGERFGPAELAGRATAALGWGSTMLIEMSLAGVPTVDILTSTRPVSDLAAAGFSSSFAPESEPLEKLMQRLYEPEPQADIGAIRDHHVKLPQEAASEFAQALRRV